MLLSLFTIICCTKSKDSIWLEYKTKDSIPLVLKNVLSLKSDFKIANPDEKYNSTDFIVDSLPDKQLKYVAKNKNTWRLAYTQGGFGKYNIVVECRVEKDSVFDLKYWETLHNFTNNIEFEGLVKQDKIRLKSISN